MRPTKTILFLLPYFAIAALSNAQEATLQTPETVSATKIVTQSMQLQRNEAYVTVEFQTAASGVKRTLTVRITQAELTSFVTALDTVRSGETGGALRRMNFRILGWLADNSKLKNEADQTIVVTLNP